MSDLATVPLLLVEDNEDDALLLRHAFRSLRFSNPLFTVTDGEQAIEYLSGEGAYANRAEFPLPYVVLLDLNMPKVDGLGVLQFIRETRALKHLFVIVLASSELNDDVTRAYELGADSYLVKPGDLSNVEEVIQLLRKHWLVLDRIVEFRRERSQLDASMA
jgi:CheY-like chemotaxis protein